MNKIAQWILCSFLIVPVKRSIAKDLKESEVPLVVIVAFKARYPDVYVYDWEWKKKKSLYQAEFMLKGLPNKAKFTVDGNWIQTSRSLKKQPISAAVWETIQKAGYTEWKIDDIEEQETAEYHLLYEIEIKNDKKEKLLYILPDGHLIKTEDKK